MTAEWRPWPAHTALDPNESLEAACSKCESKWRVHHNLAGYRFRCGECSDWVDVPKPETPTPLMIEMAKNLELAEREGEEASLDLATRPIESMERDADGLVHVDLPKGKVYEGDVPSSVPMGPGSLRHVRGDVRQKWTNRTILEVGGMLLAILLPMLVAQFALGPNRSDALMPLSSLLGGLLVVAIGFSAPQYTFGALRRARPWYFVEGVLAAAAFVGAAILWVQFVTTHGTGVETYVDRIDRLEALFGTGGLVIVFAVAPAIFEELAFRGLLQGRLCALMGRGLGVVTTAALFAAAHGISVGTPLHLSIGLYLGVLRLRSGSLIPCMLVHALYNGTLVLNHFV